MSEVAPAATRGVEVLSLLETHDESDVSVIPESSIQSTAEGEVVGTTYSHPRRDRTIEILSHTDTVTDTVRHRGIEEEAGLTILGVTVADDKMTKGQTSSRSPNNDPKLSNSSQKSFPTVRRRPSGSGTVGEVGFCDISLSMSTPQSICLCQAPARIPRPRNAFILFRQHHHAAVVAQYPGKANPEISKIIGQMWKSSSKEVKGVWQGHADEEKRQHLQRYPQYRYQPRRNTKKNSSTNGSVTAIDPISPSIKTAKCPNCGGRTGSLTTPQTSVSTVTRKTYASTSPTSKTSTIVSSAPSKKSTLSSDECLSHVSIESMVGTGIDHAGVEALLQLGFHGDDDGFAEFEGHSLKRRKLSQLSAPHTLSHSVYASQLGPEAGPGIEPYLRHGSFDHTSPREPEESMNGPHSHQGSTPPTEVFSLRAVPILKKIHAIRKICPPIPTVTLPTYNSIASYRMPVISVEGDDTELVGEVYHSLSAALEKAVSIYRIDEPDDLVLSEAYLEGLLNGTGLDRDRDMDTDDTDAARYLNHVASWRRKSIDIRRRVITAEEVDRGPQVVLINRYILSRSDAAALRLSSEALSPLEHWQWCAALWRSCIGPDMTVYVYSASDGEDGIESRDDGKVLFVRKAVESGDSVDKLVRQLACEVGKLIRSLKSLGG